MGGQKKIAAKSGAETRDQAKRRDDTLAARRPDAPWVAAMAGQALSPESLLALQRTAGNAAVGTLVARKPAPAALHAPAKAPPTVVHDPVADQIQHEGKDPSNWTSFESAKQIVSNQFNWLVMQQLPGLNQWQKAASYREKHIELEILKICAIGVLAATTDGLGLAVAEGVAGVVEKQFKETLTELSKDLIREASKESMKTGFDAGVEAYKRSEEEKGESAIDEFYHVQYSLITEMANVAQSRFLGKNSNYFDHLYKKDKAKALDLLQELAGALRSQQAKAEELQFQSSVQQWAIAMAQADAGVVKLPGQAAGEPRGMTDMSHEAGMGERDRGLRGVLYLHAYVHDDEPRAPLQLDMADISGVTKPMRRVFQGKAIDDMKVPLTLILDTGTGGPITISRNEARSFFVGRIMERPGAMLWLHDRFHGRPQTRYGKLSDAAIADAYYTSGVAAYDATTLVNKEIGPFAVDKWGLELRIP